MEKSLLSVDWDYFIRTKEENWGSYLENNKNIINLWYKRYLQFKSRGKDIQKAFQLPLEVGAFWEKIKKHFELVKDIKVYVSDSHALSFDIVKNNDISTVYLFDAHADLGYGGISNLNFEVNCANWLGKLLKSRIIKQAYILYSPFSKEKPECFKKINKMYNVRYLSLNELAKEIKVSAIHICRSGAWTPPWYDAKFAQFVKGLGLPYKIISCPPRRWDTHNISLADQIYYMMA